MKELLKNTNKSEWLITGLYKVSIYICWFLFAVSFNVFLSDSIDDAKLILLVISLLILYGIRVFLKNLYKKNANDNYYNLKHSIEMYYFKKINNLSYDDLEKIDKEELSNRILEVSYNYSKIISDIFEYIIPAIIGSFILFIKLLDLSKLFGILVLFSLVGILVYSYFNSADEEVSAPNYNDLLKEFIDNIMPIRKLNIFSYCVEKLDKTKENDICILKNSDTSSDLKFTNAIFALISVILISSFIFVHNTITRLGLIIFFIIIILKLQDLLYKINPAIKNMFASSKNKVMLDSMFNNNYEPKINTKWKKINIKNGVVNYNDTTEDIKIPSFELIKKDHISIMGASGQGKSTVLNILSGIFKLDEGDILFDGNSTSEIVDAYYSSDATIFSVSLRDNLKFSNVILDEELLELIDEIGLTEWYSTLSSGLDEILSPSLTKEIAEKINIIRAIISDKDIYFFDEPTSSLDTESEKLVASILKKHFKDKTYILVSKKTILTNLCKKHYFIKNHTLLEKEPLL